MLDHYANLSKILLMGDLHLGIKSSTYFLDYHKKYFTDFLFPLIEKEQVGEVYCLGDFFDRRKSIDFITVATFIEIMDLFKNSKISFNHVLGNHDIALRESLAISGIKQYEEIIEKKGGSPHLRVISKPYLKTTENGYGIVFLPWVCKENKESILYALDAWRSSNNFVAGHFQLAGFQIMKGYESDNGTLELSDFQDYKHVFSGHFHLASEKDNVTYIGSATELMWSDFGTDKQVYIIELKTGEVTSHKFHAPIFHKLLYPEVTQEQLNSIPDGAYIKVLVNEQDSNFDNFISALKEDKNPNELKIILPTETINTTEIENISIEEPFEILRNVIKNSNAYTDEDKKYIINECANIYQQVTMASREKE